MFPLSLGARYLRLRHAVGDVAVTPDFTCLLDDVSISSFTRALPAAPMRDFDGPPAEIPLRSRAFPVSSARDDECVIEELASSIGGRCERRDDDMIYIR